jgi:electron transfer flavoprotein alpha subunit
MAGKIPSGGYVRPDRQAESLHGLGISGSFQHLGGIKGNPFVVAVNKNPKAPIFQVADVGIEADILDFLPELTDAINEQ